MINLNPRKYIIPKVPNMKMGITNNKKNQTSTTIIDKSTIGGNRKNLKSSPSSLVYEFTRYGLLECNDASDSIMTNFKDFDLMKKVDNQCNKSAAQSDSIISAICNTDEISVNKKNRNEISHGKPFSMIGKFETTFPYLPTFSPISSDSKRKMNFFI